MEVDMELKELVRKIFEIIPSYYNEREATPIEVLIKTTLIVSYIRCNRRIRGDYMTFSDWQKRYKQKKKTGQDFSPSPDEAVLFDEQHGFCTYQIDENARMKIARCRNNLGLYY